MARMINIRPTATFPDEQEATPEVFTEDLSVTDRYPPSLWLAAEETGDLSITGQCTHRNDFSQLAKLNMHSSSTGIATSIVSHRLDFCGQH
jgi:hypothetical protein